MLCESDWKEGQRAGDNLHQKASDFATCLRIWAFPCWKIPPSEDPAKKRQQPKIDRESLKFVKIACGAESLVWRLRHPIKSQYT